MSKHKVGFELPSVGVMCEALKNPCVSQLHMLAALFLLHYTGFLFFPLPSLSIFSSPAGQGSPAAARAHSSLPTFSSTCSYLAKPTGILKAWRRAICCPALQHFTPPIPRVSACILISLLFSDGGEAEMEWLLNPRITFSWRERLCRLNQSRTRVAELIYLLQDDQLRTVLSSDPGNYSDLHAATMAACHLWWTGGVMFEASELEPWVWIKLPCYTLKEQSVVLLMSRETSSLAEQTN